MVVVRRHPDRRLLAQVNSLELRKRDSNRVILVHFRRRRSSRSPLSICGGNRENILPNTKCEACIRVNRLRACRAFLHAYLVTSGSNRIFLEHTS